MAVDDPGQGLLQVDALAIEHVAVRGRRLPVHEERQPRVRHRLEDGLPGGQVRHAFRGVGGRPPRIDLDPEDVGTPYIGLEYALNDNWAADFLFADDETDCDGSGIDTDITTWQVGLKHYFGSGYRRFLPFVGIGAGEIEFEADQFDTVETTLNAGGGVRYDRDSHHLPAQPGRGPGRQRGGM